MRLIANLLYGRFWMDRAASLVGVALLLLAGHLGAQEPRSTACPAGAEAGPNRVGLEIRVFAEPVGVIYGYGDLEKAVRPEAERVALLLEENDIEECLVAPAPSAVIELRLTPEASARLGPGLDSLRETQPFVVSVDGERRFVGVVYDPRGAAAIQTPVLHRGRRGEGRVVVVATSMGAAFSRELRGGDAGRIDLPEIRARFAARGRLREDPERSMPEDFH